MTFFLRNRLPTSVGSRQGVAKNGDRDQQVIVLAKKTSHLWRTGAAT